MIFSFASPLFLVSFGATVGVCRAHETTDYEAKYFQPPSFSRNTIETEREVLAYTEEDTPIFEGTQDRPYEADSCPSTCELGDFCGIDSSCHGASCENVYEFGVPAYTHKNPEESEALKCINFADGERDRTFFEKEDIECYGLNELPMAVSFQCGASDSCPRGSEDGPFVPMNRKCTAKTTRQRFFSCYDIAPQTDLDVYFADYIAETEMLQAKNTTCENAEMPRHDYGDRVDYVFWKPKNTYIGLSYGNGHPSGKPGDEFNLTLASLAMIARSDLLSKGHDDPESFPRCADDGGCGYDEFCGIDETCHFRDCENFYDFGPTQFTGNKTTASQGLTCYVDGVPENITPPCIDVGGTFPTLVHLTCQPINGWISTSNTMCIGHDEEFEILQYGGMRTNGRFAVANRVCKAAPNAQQEFLCYDMAPKTNLTTYFQDYVDSISADPSCSLDDQPSEFYGNMTWATDQHEVESCFSRPGYTDCTHGYRSLTFNPEVMMPPAMYTKLTGLFLARQEEEEEEEEEEEQEEEEDSAFSHGGATFWIAFSASMLLIV